MEDNPITSEELNSELTGLNKGESEKNKKKIIIGIAAGTILIAAIIIIIIVASSSDSSKNKSVIGEINYILDVSSGFDDTLILGNDYEKKSDFDIYIDNQKKRYSKKYNFDSPGKHNVTLKLYGELNMDYMFKGVEDLIEVYMTSEKKRKDNFNDKHI